MGKLSVRDYGKNVLVKLHSLEDGRMRISIKQILVLDFAGLSLSVISVVGKMLQQEVAIYRSSTELSKLSQLDARLFDVLLGLRGERGAISSAAKREPADVQSSLAADERLYAVTFHPPANRRHFETGRRTTGSGASQKRSDTSRSDVGGSRKGSQRGRTCQSAVDDIHTAPVSGVVDAHLRSFLIRTQWKPRPSC